MKCPNCGSNLTIDDAKCSFCGGDNPFAVQHRKEMRRFTKEFNKTKADVMQKSQRLHHWAAKITLIAVLLAVNLLIIVFNMDSYSVEHFFTTRKIAANYEKHAAKLAEYEATGNYIALSEYYAANDLYYSDLFDEYQKVYYVCNYYGDLYEYIMQIKTEYQEEESYFTLEDRLEYAAELIGYIYENKEPDKYDDMEMYKPVHQECMNDVVEQMENLVQVYFNLTDEEIATLPEMSNARRQILMEEGIVRNE